MDLPSKAYALKRDIILLEHDLEIWELTRCAESRQAVMGVVGAISKELAQIAAVVGDGAAVPAAMQARMVRPFDGSSQEQT